MDILEEELATIKEVERVEGIKDIEKAIEPRTRNTRIIDLVEGDILINKGVLTHVSSGEVGIYADGTVDLDNGEIAIIDEFALGQAIASGATIFNMEDVYGKDQG